MFYIEVYKIPIENKWVLRYGMYACILILPTAFIAGYFRKMPILWQIVDCYFGVFGFILLYIIYQKIEALKRALITKLKTNLIMDEIIFGFQIDGKTRCIHHCTQVDVVAIKMKCCNKFYACIKCHDEMEEHQAETWSKSEFDDKVVLCGNCRCEMTVNAYLFLKCCPDCDHEFNDKCKNHFHYYFDPWKGKRKVSWRLVKHFCYFFLLAFYFHPIDFNGWLFFN